MTRKVKLIKVYSRDHQIALYTPPTLLQKIVDEAERRNRKLGPTCLEIIREYFERQEKGGPKFADT